METALAATKRNLLKIITLNVAVPTLEYCGTKVALNGAIGFGGFEMHLEWIRKCSLLAILVLGLGAGSLYADPISLQLTSGATTVTITDGGAGDLNTASGVITYVGSVGSFNINVTTGIGSSALPGASIMDLNSVNVASSPGTLTISLSEQNISVLPTFDLAFGGTIQNGTVSASAYVDPSNAFFGTSNLLGTIGPFSGSLLTTTAFSGTASGAAAITGSYSLTSVMVITMNGPGSYSGDFDVTPVPEPSSVLLFGTGLAGLAIWARKRSAAK